MACLGVLFAIDQQTVDLITSLSSDEERVEYVAEVLEEDYFDNHPQWVGELDKAWDALHRSLTDGKLTYDNGEFPLSHVIFGGEVLCSTEDYIIVLKNQDQVKAIAKAVAKLTKEELSAGYFQLDADEYGDAVTADDFEYTWQWFESSKEFWQRAAEGDRDVLFTVDQ